jgi:hypothetical protein
VHTRLVITLDSSCFTFILAAIQEGVAGPSGQFKRAAWDTGVSTDCANALDGLLSWRLRATPRDAGARASPARAPLSPSALTFLQELWPLSTHTSHPAQGQYQCMPRRHFEACALFCSFLPLYASLLTPTPARCQVLCSCCWKASCLKSARTSGRSVVLSCALLCCIRNITSR